jgi:hypothetical protein
MGTMLTEWIDEVGIPVDEKPLMRIPRPSEEMAGDPYLYRALRADEIEAGCVLVPKGQGPFAAHPRGGVDTRPGTSEERVLRRHRWRQRGCPSRGVSTTPHLYRAQFYARPGGVIVELDRRTFDRNWVREYVLKEVLAHSSEAMTAPEDDEVILVCELEGPLPREIVRRVIRLKSAASMAVANVRESGMAPYPMRRREQFLAD